ncbi:TetR/AcrR family transcriptional regulator [Advenella alkanexedens]|uniref:TetR/AcrR family transcriptional regulator n=1 Tax=Advenella alkanexedens TaxID=1481665 RepID=A0ABS6NRL3_9BURK|nr:MULTISPECIES: TetR/AcrR family transcriptional regulator [Advenella]MBV4398241.1 TetR/AcrR family transcriptional regulator [Advenella alkanexedens]
MARRTEAVFMQQLTALLITEGISKLTIADIAARLKCSKRRIYQIAPGKEELFLHICREVFNSKLEQGFAKANKESEPVRIIKAYLTATLNTSGISKACLIDLEATEQGRKLFDDYQLARVRGLEGIIEEGIKQQVFAPQHPRLVSEAILGAAHRLRNPVFLEETGMRIGDAFEQFYRLVLEGLLKRHD